MECRGTPLDVLAADLGMPDASFSFFEAIRQISERDVIHNDTPTVLLNGKGNPSSPLTAQLTSNAIHSNDGSVLVDVEDDGTFNLSIQPSQEASITSPDGSIAVVPPQSEGGPFELSIASTFTGSPSIDVNKTSGHPPDYSFSLSSTALLPSNDPSLTPVSTLFSGGKFYLGVAIGPSGGIIPRTVTLGGVIGSTPSATTLADAVNLLPPGPYPIDQSWNILVLPGLHVVSSTVIIPPNINLIALERNSATFFGVGAIILEDTSGDDSSNSIVGLEFSGGIDLVADSEDKTGGTYSARIENCTFDVMEFTTSLRIGDEVSLLCCVTTSSSSIISGGGSLSFSQCSISSSLSTSLTSSISVFSGTFSPTLILAHDSTLTLVGVTLGGEWRLFSSGTTVNITSCRPTPSWTVRCNASSRSYIRSTELPLVLEVVDPETWRVNFPNLLPADSGVQGTVDRSFTLNVVIPTSLIASRLSFLLPVPLIDISPSILVSSRGNQTYSSDTSDNTTIVVVNQSTMGGKMSLGVHPLISP